MANVDTVIEKKEDGTMKAMMGMVVIVMMFGVMGSFIPKPPQPQYQCPICGEWFWTYDEMMDHIANTHPAVDISIEWE